MLKNIKHYNERSRFPSEVIVVRHGQSKQNVHAIQEIKFPRIVDRLYSLFGEYISFKFTQVVDHMRNKKTLLGIPDKDVPLTDAGADQAARTARELIKNRIIPDVILSSSFKRAVQTTEIMRCAFMQEGFPLSMYTHDFLREKSEGENDGIPRTYLKHIRRIGAKLFYEQGHLRYRPKGGENAHDVYVRILNDLERTLMNYPNKKVMIVAHGMTNMCIDLALMHEDIKKAIDNKWYRMPNLAITRYLYSADKEHWLRDEELQRTSLIP